MKIATPVSHLFQDPKDGLRIAAASDCLEGRPRNLELAVPRQELFHCDEIQPIHRMREDEFAYIRRVKELKPELKLITFHCASCCDQPVLGLGGRVWMDVGGRTYTRDEMKQNARENFSKIRAILGPGIAMGIENNNYYPTPAYERVTDPDLISEIVYENNVNLLLDVAHVQVSCGNSGGQIDDYLRRLPLDRMAQMHISRFGVHPEVGWAMDDHERPTAETFALVQQIIARWQPTYLTVEYYRNTDVLLASLDDLRALVRQRAPMLAADASVHGAA